MINKLELAVYHADKTITITVTPKVDDNDMAKYEITETEIYTDGKVGSYKHTERDEAIITEIIMNAIRSH